MDLTEADLALIHALQLSPRISWTGLAPILQTTPAALARRWQRIRAEGLAWVTAYPRLQASPGTVNALVEVDCDAGRSVALCEMLAADPRIASIEHAAQGRDLVLVVFAAGLADLSAMMIDELPALDGVRSTRVHVTTTSHLEGSRWRLDALDRRQREALRTMPATGLDIPAASGGLAAAYLPLARALAHDGRASAAELADALGRPASTLRRQLAVVLRSGHLHFRCEVAQLATRWPVANTWWCRAPSAQRSRIVEALRDEPRLRLCLSSVGPVNLIVHMWTASLEDLMRAQHRLEAVLGAGEIVDASLTLRARKRMGWMLHPDGRATGEVIPIAGLT